MCELLGMSANVPTDICFSFTRTCTAWWVEPGHIKMAGALPFTEGKGCRTFKDPQPSFNSPSPNLSVTTR